MTRWAGWLVVVAGLVAGCREGGGGTGNATAGFKANPAALDFGPTALGQPKSLDVQVVNSGRAPFNVLSVKPSVANVAVPDFAPFTLSGGETKVLHVTFSPEVEGQLSGVIQLETDAPSSAASSSRLPLAGMGVKAFAKVAPDPLDYGNVELNTVVMAQIPLRNPTAVPAPVRIHLSGPDVDQFTAADADKELTLAPGEARAVPVAFKPTRLGVAQAVAQVLPCAGCEDTRVQLQGSGVASRLDISPMVVDFGRVPVGAVDEESVVIRNLGDEPFALQGARLVGNPGGVFEITRQPLPGQLPPGGSVEISVAFRPTAPGQARGGLLALGVVRQGSADPGPKLALVAEGGNSCVTVLPRTLDFGTVPEGFDATRQVEVFNRCPQEVSLSSFALATTSGGYFSLGQASSLVLASGATTPLPITFRPKVGAGASAGALTFKVRQGTSTATEHVALAGAGRKFAACSYRLDTPEVDYGLVPVGAEVTLGVGLTNTGADACYVSGMGLMAGSDPQFVAQAWTSALIEPGKRAVLPVKFKPTAEGAFSGMAEAWVNHPSLGHATVPLTGKGVLDCLTAQPTTVDFGLVKLGCAPRTRAVAVVNQCATAQTVSAKFAPGASSDFSLDTPPAGPVTLAPGETATLQLRYAPADEGVDLAAFLVDAGKGPLTVGLLGEGRTRPVKTDRFLQESHSKVDVLFVMDNSGSMAEEQQSLSQNLASFLLWAERNNIDYHIAVTTTGIEAAPSGWSVCPGGAEGGEAGRLFPVNGSTPRVITSDTANREAVFASNVQVGICHWNELGIEAAYRALSPPLVNNADDPSTPLPNDGNLGFLRDDARLAVVFISDEDDSSTGSVSFYETFFKGLKGNDPALLSLSAIVGPEDLSTCPTASGTGSRYIALANATGGVVESICTPDWAASLVKLGRNAFSARRTFQLSEPPADAASITVQVNGAAVTAGWSYDPATNSVTFTEDAVPLAGSIIDIAYPLGCG